MAIPRIGVQSTPEKCWPKVGDAYELGKSISHLSQARLERVSADIGSGDFLSVIFPQATPEHLGRLIKGGHQEVWKGALGSQGKHTSRGF